MRRSCPCFHVTLPVVPFPCCGGSSCFPRARVHFHPPLPMACVCGGGGEGWRLKGAVSVPSLHARAPLHARLQSTALRRGARVHRAEWNGGPEAQKSAFSQQLCLGARETDLAPGAFTVLPLGQYWVNKYLCRFHTERWSGKSA